jgi:broad specificity phosphatase PhoE
MIHLIRHARPTLAGVLLGSTDSPLASVNIAESKLQVDRVISSPLSRALKTAQQMFPQHEITVLPDLAERCLGHWETKRWAEVEEEWPELAAKATADWFGTTPPGGEPWHAFRTRVTNTWKTMSKVNSTAIVAHVGVNAVLWHLATGGDLSQFQQEYEEVISIDLSR